MLGCALRCRGAAVQDYLMLAMACVAFWHAGTLRHPLGPMCRNASPTTYHLQDIVSESPERFFVSEIIRKHIFLQYQQEVPYSVAGGGTRFLFEEGGVWGQAHSFHSTSGRWPAARLVGQAWGG